jgi:nicotinate phosphoribosyltransferase
MRGTYVDTVFPETGDGLVVVDLQEDFLPGGALPVPGGDKVVPPVKRFVQQFTALRLPVYATRDWHPANHCSFKEQGGCWPPHCIQGESGAQFAPDVQLPATAFVVSKGTEADKEAYSAFSGTNLHGVLSEQGIRRLFVCGVATDYCVLETVKDAISAGFQVVLLSNAVKPVGSEAGRRAVREMIELGVDVYEPPRTTQSSAETSTLLTDLYELTMLQGYYDCEMEAEAVFEFFVRKLPARRNFLITVGLEQVLDFLEGLRFTEQELKWLDECGRFHKGTLDRLAALRFTGDVHAMPEGTIFFPHEPILRVTAPLPEAQLVESRLMNLLHFQTVIASKAARCALAAPGKLLVDFGMRRAHGAEAALLAARASYLAGFDGSATVLAGMRFDIPVYGTMAHSFVQAHDDEIESFQHFAAANPDNVVLLLDTYDTEAAAEKIIPLIRQLKSQGIRVNGVRLDSGDLAQHARRVRGILDQAGLSNVTIFASGNLDEDKLRDYFQSAVPIDGYGIGSRLDVSSDAPYLDCAYKLQEYAGQPRRKRSEGKATWPARKQVFRNFQNGLICGDVITIEGDERPGQPLLEPMMMGGHRLEPRATAVELRERVANNLTQLPAALKSLDPAAPYTVAISTQLRQLAAKLDGKSMDAQPFAD